MSSEDEVNVRNGAVVGMGGTAVIQDGPSGLDPSVYEEQSQICSRSRAESRGERAETVTTPSS